MATSTMQQPEVFEKRRLTFSQEKDNLFPMLKDESIYKSYIDKREIDQVNDSEAFYAVNLSKIEEHFAIWTREMRGIKPYYAIKCNGNDRLIALLDRLGCGFDCASKAEIEKFQKISGKTKREDVSSNVIFAHPIKKTTDLNFAKRVGVDHMVCDCSYELEKVAKYYPHAKILIRIKTDDSSSKCQFSTKFGVRPTDVEELLECAKKLGLSIVGVSFHVGSGCMCAKAYHKALLDVGKIFKIAKEKYGMLLSIVDIGGGFPGLIDEKSRNLFKEIALEVRSSFDSLFSQFQNVRMIAEPGRFFATAPFTLMTKVIGKRKVGDGFHYYINDGIYSSFNCIMFDHYEFNMKHFKNGGKKTKGVIWGPTCDSIDKLVSDITLPEFEIGDWVYFENFGAYTISGACPFNGFITNDIFYYWK